MNTNVTEKDKKEEIREIAKSIGMEVSEQDVINATLTDEQLNSVCNVLRDNRPELLDERMNFNSEEYDKYMDELNSTKHEAVANVMVNSDSCATMVGAVQQDNTEVEDFDLQKLFDEQKSEITLDICKSTFVDVYGITDEHDQEVLYNAILDVEHATFDQLPQVIKNVIITTVGDNKDKIEEFTKYMLNDMKGDIVTDKAINIDLAREINKFKSESSQIMDEALEYNRELLEVELTKQYNATLEKGYKKQAEQIKRCIDSFKDSYTFRPLYREWKALKIKGKKVSIKKYLDSEVKNYQQYTMRFDNRYRTTKLNIHSSTLIVKTLKRIFQNESEDILKKFVILFCMYSSLLDPKKWEDHIYMYYTIHDIISLDMIKDKSNGFAKEIIDNLQKVIDDVIK